MSSGKWINDEVLSSLLSLVSKAGSRYWIGVDIGATNTRVSLATESENLLLCRFVAGSTRHQLQVFEQLAQELSPVVRSQPSSGSAIAGAGRILKQGEEIDITNFKGGPEHRFLLRSELPPLLFPLPVTVFLNDLQAASYGVLSLAMSGRLGSYFSPLWGKQVDFQSQGGHYLIVAPGTGLGASALLWFGDVQKYIAMPLEAGHTSVPLLGPEHPEFAYESDLFAFVSRKCWQGRCAIEFEDLVCGQGVVNIYLWLCDRHRHTPPATLDAQVIVDLAFAEPADALASEALYLHYRFMARFSANLTVCTQVAGVFWAGSNQVLNDKFIRSRAADLQRDWSQHSKAEWLQDVPVLGQIQDVNVNILGTILIAQRQVAPQINANL